MRRLHLLPGQAVKPPAGKCGALKLFVQLAFKAVYDMLYIREAGRFQCLAGVQRALAGAADQQHRLCLAGGFARDGIGELLRVRLQVGYSYHGTLTTPGGRPTYSDSISMRTSTNRASGCACNQVQASLG